MMRSEILNCAEPRCSGLFVPFDAVKTDFLINKLMLEQLQP